MASGESCRQLDVGLNMEPDGAIVLAGLGGPLEVGDGGVEPAEVVGGDTEPQLDRSK